MSRYIVFFFVLMSSFLSFNSTDCGGVGKAYVYYSSFESHGTKLYVKVHTAEVTGVEECSFIYDNEPDTTRVICAVYNGSDIDRTIVFVDSTTIVLDGKNGICREVKPSNPGIDEYSYVITLWHKDIYVKTTTNDTHRVWRDFRYFSPEDEYCDEYYARKYELDLRFLVRSDSPYVWIKFLCYDSVFVSPETTAYLIEEPFPFTEQGSFRLARRRVFRLHLDGYYHYGAFELIPESDTGWAKLRVSFSVVPRLGWTLPPTPVDTTL